MDGVEQERFDALLRAAIGGKIRSARTERGWSQEHLADLASVTRSAVQRMEQGLASPTVVDFGKICAVLEISVGEVFESGREKAVRLFELENSGD